MTLDGPRVFQKGTMTAVVGADGSSLHVGAVELRLYSAFAIRFEVSTRAMEVRVSYAPGGDEETRRATEEEQRLLVADGWMQRIA